VTQWWLALLIPAALAGLGWLVRQVVDAAAKREDPKNKADSASVLTHAAAELATSYVNRMDQMEADHKATIERIEAERMRDKEDCDHALLVLTTKVETLTAQFTAAAAAEVEKAELLAQVTRLETALADCERRKQ
jgi:hypothetical protein